MQAFILSSSQSIAAILVIPSGHNWHECEVDDGYKEMASFSL